MKFKPCLLILPKTFNESFWCYDFSIYQQTCLCFPWASWYLSSSLRGQVTHKCNNDLRNLKINHYKMSFIFQCMFDKGVEDHTTAVLAQVVFYRKNNFENSLFIAFFSILYNKSVAYWPTTNILMFFLVKYYVCGMCL